MSSLKEMKQVSVSEILKEHSLVVPEIQREYVWGRNDYDILNTFLEDIKKEFNNKDNVEDDQTRELLILAENANEKQKKVLLELIEKNSKVQKSMNIGFLYSYKPDYYISDEGKDAYLIDGQQRFTTIFLILFYLAIKENRKEDFLSMFRVSFTKSKIAFDYRVRALTHNFLLELIHNTTVIEDLLSMAEKRWFLSNYKKDTTVRSIAGDISNKGAFKIIHEQLQNIQDGCFDFVKDKIKFWHFKTEETSQGEELYITMNSRGQQLMDNETIRAVLFQSEVAQNNPLKWSALWEEWQDFFWKNRADESNSADEGFNSFLSCIGALENYLSKETERFYSKEEFERYNQVSAKTILKSLSLSIIKKYMDALIHLVAQRDKFQNQYGYSRWIDKALKEVWEILNKEKINWYSDYKDDKRGTERNKMIYLWPILTYYSKKDLNSSDITNDLFRLFRIYYLRYHNFDRSVTTINDDVSNFSEKGIWNENCYPEENQKHILLKKTREEDVFKLEELIWEIEDHKLNLNGRDVGSINIGYLVDFEKHDNIDEIKLIKDKFYEMFPIGQKDYLIIQNLLLYYGEYWHRISPGYYFNYQFDNWRRIIRDRDNDNKPTRNAFKRFFTDFLDFNGTINQFLEHNRETKLVAEECNTLFKKLCWYNQFLNNKMWTQGNYIAISNSTDYNALPDDFNKDKVFSEVYIIYNTKGNLRGGDPTKLYDLIPPEIKQAISSNE